VVTSSRRGCPGRTLLAKPHRGGGEGGVQATRAWCVGAPAWLGRMASVTMRAQDKAAAQLLPPPAGSLTLMTSPTRVLMCTPSQCAARAAAGLTPPDRRSQQWRRAYLSPTQTPAPRKSPPAGPPQVRRLCGPGPPQVLWPALLPCQGLPPRQGRGRGPQLVARAVLRRTQPLSSQRRDNRAG
jgi:hypothetical protein